MKFDEIYSLQKSFSVKVKNNFIESVFQPNPMEQFYSTIIDFAEIYRLNAQWPVFETYSLRVLNSKSEEVNC